MIYVDTSVIVAALTQEALTARAQIWLSKQMADTLVISPWVVTEVSSALAIKVRAGSLEAAQRAEALAAWKTIQMQSLQVVIVQPSHFEMAARFVDQERLGLRAGDALHLAIAADAGYRLATFDRAMADAGIKLGVPTFAPK